MEPWIFAFGNFSQFKGFTEITLAKPDGEQVEDWTSPMYGVEGLVISIVDDFDSIAGVVIEWGDEGVWKSLATLIGRGGGNGVWVEDFLGTGIKFFGSGGGGGGGGEEKEEEEDGKTEETIARGVSWEVNELFKRSGGAVDFSRDFL